MVPPQAFGAGASNHKPKEPLHLATINLNPPRRAPRSQAVWQGRGFANTTKSSATSLLSRLEIAPLVPGRTPVEVGIVEPNCSICHLNAPLLSSLLSAAAAGVRTLFWGLLCACTRRGRFRPPRPSMGNASVHVGWRLAHPPASIPAPGAFKRRSWHHT